jgi:hypothetical protein
VKRVLVLAGALAAAVLAVSPAPAGRAQYACRPTVNDGDGPFGRGLPPMRAKIGTGHVLTGIVVSAVNCRPLPRAQVQLWQAGPRGYTRATSATVLTSSSGRFRFEGPYPTSYGRQPHIHLRVVARNHEVLLTRFVPAPRAKRGSIRLVLEPALL